MLPHRKPSAPLLLFSQRSPLYLTQVSHYRRPSTTIRSPQRPINWKALAPEPLPGTPTFAAQSTLPRLPVPDLTSTLSHLKRSLMPIAWSDAEYADVLRKIGAFAESKGPVLQERLLRRAGEREHWLEEWWDDEDYLGYRNSPVINTSYYYGFAQPPTHLDSTPSGLAAGLARATMLFRQKLKQGRIQPDFNKDGPLCMNEYRWMFDCCRVPGEKIDWHICHAKSGEEGNTGHVIVIRKNRLWKVELTHNGRIVSTPEIQRQIEFIYEDTLEEYPGVSVLTASGRDIWAKDLATLQSEPHNSQILDEISSAAFVIYLDSSQPRDPIHLNHALWHGDIVDGIPVGLRNRWVDKPLQFIVFDNGCSGLMGEHSVVDGTPTTRLCNDVLEMLYDPAFDHGTPPDAVETMKGAGFSQPTPLDWQITPAIKQAIAVADRAAVGLVNTQDIGLHATSYGRADIKAFGVSPDSWAQMIIQLAYKRFNAHTPRMGGTYATASTRRFLKGRINAIRVVTSESDEWVRSMDDPYATLEMRKKAFDLAASKHVSLAKASGQGQGVDYHLFGLRKLLKEGEMLPKLYDDPVFKRSSKWVLSTSCIFSKHFSLLGFGAVVPDGFGVAYITGFEDRLQYTVTARKEMKVEQFVHEIAKAAEDLYTLYCEVTPHSCSLPVAVQTETG